MLGSNKWVLMAVKSATLLATGGLIACEFEPGVAGPPVHDTILSTRTGVVPDVDFEARKHSYTSIVDVSCTKGSSGMPNDERRAGVLKMFTQEPDFFREERRASILKGVVEIGMSPHEARLAGGAFFYRVVADTSKWPEHSDPMRVIWAQTMHPDNSEITMTFKNSSQSPKCEEMAFEVHFVKGRVVRIESKAGKA